MIEVGLKAAKEGFFDKEKVVAAVGRANAAGLRKSSNKLKTIAQRSMRYRKNKPGLKGSAPGKPPYARTGKGGHSALVRKFLFAFYDASTKSAVIGPIRIEASKDAPHILEFGGTSKAMDRRTVRKIGDGGEAAIGRPLGRRSRKTGIKSRPTTKIVIDSRGLAQTVSYMKLKTAGQVARANRLNNQLYKPKRKYQRIGKRPFMKPAMKTTAKTMSSFWKGSVRA